MTSADFSIVPFDEFVDKLRLCLGRRAPSSAGKRFVADVTRLLEREEGWLRLEETWQDGDDLAIYRRFEAMMPLKGTIYVLSDYSYESGPGPYKGDRGAFKTTSDRFERFVSDHLAVFGALLFDLDVFVLSVEQCRLWVFHDEGWINAFDFLLESKQPHQAGAPS
jgi:hypothetical protein